MRTALFPRTTSLARTRLLLLAAVISFASGTSALIFRSPLSPLIVAGAVFAAVLVALSLRNPIWALYAAIFVLLLPAQIVRQFPIRLVADYGTVLGLLFACVCWLFGVVVYRRRIVWTSTILVMLAFLVWSVITLFWAHTSLLGRQALIAYVTGFTLLLLLINEIDSRQTLNGLMTTMALSGWFIIFTSIGTLLAEGYTTGTRLQILGINANSLGVILLVTMPGILWQVVKPEGPRTVTRVVMAVVFLLLTVGLVAMSGSRGSTISLSVTLLAFLLWQPTRRWGALGLVVLALGVAIAPFIFQITLERFAVTAKDTVLGGREALWQAAVELILDHPWGGVGIGNAEYAVMPYLQLLRGVLGREQASIHNPVLTIWAEAGIFGLLLYLGALGSALWSLARQGRKSRRLGSGFHAPYFAVVAGVFSGYMASWIKSGGMQCDSTYFLMLALLLIPTRLRGPTEQ